jgi:hypothetical protein
MELGKNGDMKITLAGGGAELTQEQMLGWFQHTVQLLAKGFTDPAN